METIKLPRTDLVVSRIALGTWLFGGRRWGSVDDAESTRAISVALELGINLFDTADAYGIGKAEEMLGHSLAARPDIHVATKVGVVWRNDGTRYHDLSAEHVTKACESSLRRLRRDRIDLYQLHDIDLNTPLGDTGSALAGLLESGKIRYVGVSNYAPGQIEELSQYVPVVSVQSEYSLIERGIENEVLPFCQNEGLGLLTYTPLYRGLLNGKFGPGSTFPEDDNRSEDSNFQGRRFADNLVKVHSLANVAAEEGRTLGQTAIRWLLDTSGVSVVICGARSAEQVQENAGSLGWSLGENSYKRLAEAFAE